MPRVEVNGVSLAYEEMGSGPAIVWMQGGRSGRDLMRPIAQGLASEYRCVIYDRRNCGESDVLIGGDASEQEIWADELAGLIQKLDLGPAYLGGWSAGCRVAILTAIRHQSLVKGLLLGWVTGGGVAAQRLSHQYYGQFIEAARQGGMAAVAATPFFAERIQMNPSNRERLLSMDPAAFIAVMERWSRYFTEGADLPVIGATEEELKTIRVPVSIVAGDDDVHPLKAARDLHRILPDSEFHDPPIPRPEWDALSESPAKRDEVRSERALPLFRNFLARVEARSAARSG